MSFEIFKDCLRKHVPLDENLFYELELRTKEVYFQKGDYILIPREASRYTFFVESGFFRGFMQNHMQEKTLDFFGPSQMCFSRAGYLQQKKTEEGIICEQDAIVHRVSYHDWRALEDLSSEFLLLTKRLLIQDLLLLAQQNELIKTSSTTQQYLDLKARYPAISNLVSQRSIASYLGISESTMSGIIKSLLFKPK